MLSAYFAHGKWGAKRLIVLLPLLVLGCILLSSCSPATPTGVTTRQATTVSVTSTPTLEPLLTPVGSKTVVSLGETTLPAATSGATYDGQFVATNTYFIIYSCEGAGSLTITYPEAQEFHPCNATPQLSGTQYFQPTGIAQTVVVTVQRQGAVVWNLAVEMQN